MCRAEGGGRAHQRLSVAEIHTVRADFSLARVFDICVE